MDRNVSLGDANPDDLPRTLRRQRDAQQRAQQQYAPQPQAPMSTGDWPHDDFPQPAIVTGFKVPFFRLMMFYIKSVLAGIPALILLLAILWGVGELLMTYFPWLVKVQIHIQVPH